MVHLTQQELLRAKEALGRFTKDPQWRDCILHEDIYLFNLQNSSIDLGAANYAERQAFKDGQIAAIKALKAERVAILSYNTGEVENGTVLQFKPKSK